MIRWEERVAATGLSAPTSQIAAATFEQLQGVHRERFGVAETRAWWVPGRIEVLGKHTDYGGGRSLLCAVERGFHVVASARDDRVVRIVDGSTGSTATIPFTANADPRPGYWTDYPITVVRRLARDFPDAQRGMNAVFRSTLPTASGLSSSSALVIACFLPLAAFNALEKTDRWNELIPSGDALAEYVGATENGRACRSSPPDRGVGTQGGSEDQTAILRASPDHLLQYHFLPVTHEATIAIPGDWSFVIAMSGVHAAKGSAVQARYNALADEVARLLATWNTITGRTDASLFAAITSAPDAPAQLERALAADTELRTLQPRLEQFRSECTEIIPAVAAGISRGDVESIGEPVARSQFLAESVLRNQVPETMHLSRSARDLGAAAASAFGAGFGGSVWAMVRAREADAFRERWLEDYVRHFPERRTRADFFVTRAGPAAREI